MAKLQYKDVAIKTLGRPYVSTLFVGHPQGGFINIRIKLRV